jgi:hypothetical protein
MRGGFRVLRLDLEANKLTSETGAWFSEAGEGEDWEALAYGVDWASPNVLAGCSFYDSTFRVLLANPPSVDDDNLADNVVTTDIAADDVAADDNAIACVSESNVTVDVQSDVQGSDEGGSDAAELPPLSSLTLDSI